MEKGGAFRTHYRCQIIPLSSTPQTQEPEMKQFNPASDDTYIHINISTYAK